MNKAGRKTVVIVGLGLIGGSLGMALRRARSKAWRVVGLGRDQASLRLAKKRGACDEIGRDWRSALLSADLVVICTPPSQVLPVTKKIIPWTRPGVIISDVASVKGPILAGWRSLNTGRKVSFVGAHPMAGSEASGIAHARPNLFQNASCGIIPLPGGPASAVHCAEAMWKATGARPFRVQAASHDKAVALTSHLPHLIAASLMLSLAQQHRANPVVKKFVARSFLDLTRVAASDPALWADIFKMNRSALRSALVDLEKAVHRLDDGKQAEALLRVTSQARKALSS